ncbi:hypothetical protein [Embleya sp. NPDC059237]|uniref:hypothetical protein n=1 Tax=Embleya sp. NPDC059237 TaxID=3346784 RepID=UPI0036A524BF
MDMFEVGVLIVLDGLAVDGTADIRDWYPPGAERPAGAPERWSASISSEYPLAAVAPVGARGDLHVDETGAHGRFEVVQAADYTAQVVGRGDITP